MASLANGTTINGSTAWHAGNDGSGSGLDADTLDGMQPATANTASTIVQRDSSGNFSAGTITATLSGNASTASWADTVDVNTSTSTAWYGIVWNSGDTLYTTTSAKIRPSDSAIQAPIYYDINNTNYYGNFAGTSVMNQVNMNSAYIGQGVYLHESTDRPDLLQITSNTTGWGGLQIRNISSEGRWSFMTDGESAGIYNDEGNQWHIYMTEAGATTLYYGGASKLATSSTGVTIFGTVTANSFSGDGSQLTGIKIAAGGGNDSIFHLNGQTVTTSYSIPSGQNAMTAGDITINTGVTVTIPTGSRWVIV